MLLAIIDFLHARCSIRARIARLTHAHHSDRAKPSTTLLTAPPLHYLPLPADFLLPPCLLNSFPPYERQHSCRDRAATPPQLRDAFRCLQLADYIFCRTDTQQGASRGRNGCYPAGTGRGWLPLLQVPAHHLRAPGLACTCLPALHTAVHYASVPYSLVYPTRVLLPALNCNARPLCA